VKLLHQGKVRDVYDRWDDLVLVASDRISIYDVVLPTPIPDKGAVLTQLSLWWFARLADLVPHHVLSATDVPPEFADGRCAAAASTCCPWSASPAATSPVGAEGVREARHGVGRRAAARPRRGLPAARADLHPDHQGPGRRARRVPHVRRRRGARRDGRRRSACAPSHWRSTGAAPSWPSERASSSPTPSWSSASTRRATIVLADEVLTPDSSRFWPADALGPGGRSPPSTSSSCATGRRPRLGPHPPGPEIPPDVVAATRARYTEVYEALTGVHLAMAQ
jgi:phosphoribosylaminoimidazole-succinocarboxamide synthase